MPFNLFHVDYNYDITDRCALGGNRGPDIRPMQSPYSRTHARTQAPARYWNWNTEKHIHAYGWFLRPHHGAVHECVDVRIPRVRAKQNANCYRWSWFEARSKVCSAERQAKVHFKNKVKFGTYSKRISVVCCTLVCCQSVGFKITGVTFMTVFITRRDAACFLAWVKMILPLYLPVNGTFYSSFGLQQSASCYAWQE